MVFCLTMKIIKEIKRDRFTLSHIRIKDEWGFDKDLFDITAENEDGSTTVYPFLAPIRVSNFDRNTPIIQDSKETYTQKEYNRMFNEQLEAIKKHKKS